jgi:hypothetical protein
MGIRQSDLQKETLAVEAMQLRFVEALASPMDELQRFGDGRPRFFDSAQLGISSRQHPDAIRANQLRAGRLGGVRALAHQLTTFIRVSRFGHRSASQQHSHDHEERESLLLGKSNCRFRQFSRRWPLPPKLVQHGSKVQRKRLAEGVG